MKIKTEDCVRPIPAGEWLGILIVSIIFIGGAWLLARHWFKSDKDE